MSERKEVFQQVLENSSVTLYNSPKFSDHQRSFQFAMLCNGYADRGGKWRFAEPVTKPIERTFAAQSVSIFGPGPAGGAFLGFDRGKETFCEVLSQRDVTGMLTTYRQRDENVAARIAFLLGGLIRGIDVDEYGVYAMPIKDVVRFAAQMTNLGEVESGEAIASAMMMYIFSGGTIQEVNSSLGGDVYFMGEAIKQDPITVTSTPDLGLSQVARLRHFIVNRERRTISGEMPDVSEEMKAFAGFPTVGAEFHLPVSEHTQSSDFLRRAAILNMSQYQPDSSIQMTRFDDGMLEVRMNPSVYPVTVANWKLIEHILPEIKHATFFITLNRQGPGQNFAWGSGEDDNLLQAIFTVGLLSNAAFFENIPGRVPSRKNIPYGERYLGQTVKVRDGKYTYNGRWGRQRGQAGQLSMHLGFGENFPYLAYYPSFLLAHPQLASEIPETILNNVNTLEDAYEIPLDDIERVFQDMQAKIQTDRRLAAAYKAGRTIVDKLALE